MCEMQKKDFQIQKVGYYLAIKIELSNFTQFEIRKQYNVCAVN